MLLSSDLMSILTLNLFSRSKRVHPKAKFRITMSYNSFAGNQSYAANNLVSNQPPGTYQTFEGTFKPSNNSLIPNQSTSTYQTSNNLYAPSQAYTSNQQYANQQSIMSTYPTFGDAYTSSNNSFAGNRSAAKPMIPTTVGLPTTPIQLGQKRSDFIRGNATLGERQRKYCRCLLEVQEKGSAYNPYGVCTKSTRSQVHSCSSSYDFPAMNLDMLNAYASLHKLSGYNTNDRQAALNAINQWKQSLNE